MNKRGFTLIEIIAIIILLSVIALITYPIINNLISDSREELYNKQISELERLSNTWVTKNINKLKTKDGYVYDLSFEELHEQGFVSDEQVKNPKTGQKLSGCMKVTYNSSNNGYKVAYDESCTTSGEVTLKDTLKEGVLGTDNSNIVTSGDGLYSETTNSGTTYYFKGAVENNYVKFANLIWRIVRINEDGTIRLITQDSIITEQAFNSTYDTYDKMYYTNSEIKTVVDNWYKTNITDKGFDGKVASGNYFCEQAKVATSASYTAENAAITNYSKYNPSFNCTTDGNGKGVVSGKVGLITIDEVLYAGGVIDNDSNFYLKNGKTYWMMSPAGVIVDLNNTAAACAWIVYSTGNTYSLYAQFTYGVRPVINLNINTSVTGTGTESDPYIVK